MNKTVMKIYIYIYIFFNKRKYVYTYCTLLLYIIKTKHMYCTYSLMYINEKGCTERKLVKYIIKNLSAPLSVLLSYYNSIMTCMIVPMTHKHRKFIQDGSYPTHIIPYNCDTIYNLKKPTFDI